MTSPRPAATLVLCVIYGLIFAAIILLRGLTPDIVLPLALQAIAALGTLWVLTVSTLRSTSDQIDSYYTTAANSLIGFGMILSVFTILRASSGQNISDRILSLAPNALAATATGLAGGTFFFVL